MVNFSLINHRKWNKTLEIIQEKSRISGKKKRKLSLDIEKKKSKKLKSFQKLLEQMNQSPQHNRAGRARAMQEEERYLQRN